VTVSDALVLYGASGDLALRKIFPALQRMVKAGRLDVPVRMRRARSSYSAGTG